MPKQFRLKENHSTFQKFDKLRDMAEEMGIHMSFQSGYCILTDMDKPNIRFYVEDVEGEGQVWSFPPTNETKIIYREE